MTRKPKIRAPYKMVSPATWELARAAYLSGKTAAQVAKQFDIGPHNLRQNIYKNSWSKRAYAQARGARAADAGAGPSAGLRFPEPIQDDGPAPNATFSPGDLMAIAIARASEAIVAGKGTEALSLIRATRELVMLAADFGEARADVPPEAAADEALSPALSQLIRDRVALALLRDRWKEGR